MSQIELDELRAEINKIDHDVLKLAKKRMLAAQKIGQIKNALGLSTRDFAREKQCIEFAHGAAEKLGLSKPFAERVLREFIRESLVLQERERIARTAAQNTKRALVIGGAGKMGLWFARFLDSQGFYVEISDPNGSALGFSNLNDWHSVASDFDVIVVATPIAITRDILLELAQKRPLGLVFDLSSLKEPVRTGLNALYDCGVKVCSIHPMFGPDTELLSGRHVIVVNVGNNMANQEAKTLFASTMAHIVEMDIDEHDRVAAFLLGLSHALNIAFFSVLALSGESAPRLKELSSTTFDAQLQIAARVANENPHLYFEIQSLNPYGDIPLAALSSTLANIRQMIQTKDEQAFVALMNKGYDYLRTHR